MRQAARSLVQVSLKDWSQARYLKSDAGKDSGVITLSLRRASTPDQIDATAGRSRKINSAVSMRRLNQPSLKAKAQMSSARTDRITPHPRLLLALVRIFSRSASNK
jgi:hypothetical protein